MKEASFKQRMKYYEELWNVEQVPSFILENIKNREFAFDHNGSGFNDRYRKFENKKELEEFIKIKSPYAICTSVSFYEKPEKREGWFGAELVFDIDAKDLPGKKCNCSGGNVCSICLEDAKEMALLINKTLSKSFGFKEVHNIFSGRGFHIRVNDTEALKIPERKSIIDYINGQRIPEDIELFMEEGYSNHYLGLLKYQIARLKKDEGYNKIYDNKEVILKRLNDKNINYINVEGVGEKTKENFLNTIKEKNMGNIDIKVTMDINRILRLPSSLHSKVSKICTEIKVLKSFNFEGVDLCI